MIQIQAEHETHLDPQPGGDRSHEVEHPGAEDQRQDRRRPGDAQPKAPDHYGELPAKDPAIRFGAVTGFGIVDKEPDYIEQSAEPGHDKSDMEGFYIIIHSYSSIIE